MLLYKVCLSAFSICLFVSVSVFCVCVCVCVCVFVFIFVFILGSVHTDAFSFEKANIILRFNVPPHENDENDVSFSMKTQTFENDLQSGKI